MNVIVREAEASDLTASVPLLAQLDPDDPRREDTALADVYHAAYARMIDAGTKILVVESEGSIVGTLALYILPNISHRGSPFALVENVVVDESHRGKGYGKLLMDHAEKMASEAGCYKIVLTSNAQRTDAHRFYDSLGYQRSHQGFRKNLQTAVR